MTSVSEVKTRCIALCKTLPQNVQDMTGIGCDHAVPLLWLLALQEAQRVAKWFKSKFDKDENGVLDNDTWLGQAWRSWKIRTGVWAVLMIGGVLVTEYFNDQNASARFVRLLAKNVDVVVLIVGTFFDAPRSWQLPLQSAAYALKDVAHEAAKKNAATTWVALFPATGKLLYILGPQLEGLFEGTASAIFGNLITTEAKKALKKENKDDDDDEKKDPDDVVVVVPKDTIQQTPSVVTFILFAVWIGLGILVDQNVRTSILKTGQQAITQAIDAAFVGSFTK